MRWRMLCSHTSSNLLCFAYCSNERVRADSKILICVARARKTLCASERCVMEIYCYIKRAVCNVRKIFYRYTYIYVWANCCFFALFISDDSENSIGEMGILQGKFFRFYFINYFIHIPQQVLSKSIYSNISTNRIVSVLQSTINRF